MHIYINLAHVALALALCGGFFFGRFLFTKNAATTLERNLAARYNKKYNQQMDELCTKYRQERLALIHRYEGLVAEVERELKWLKAGCDPERTQRTYILTNMEAAEATDLDQHIGDMRETDRGVS